MAQQVSADGQTPAEEADRIVVDTQPTSRTKLSESQELEALGLRPNDQHSDPCLCLSCIFCFEICLAPGGGAPPVNPGKRMVKKAIGGHNWDNDSGDFAADDNTDGLEWAIELATHFGAAQAGHHSYTHYGDDGHCDGGGDGGGDCGGGDGGGGCDGGGGE